MRLSKLLRPITKPINNLIDHANGKAKLKKQYNHCLNELNQEEVKLINKLNSDYQNLSGKLAQDQSAAHVARQHEINKHNQEMALVPVQLNKEQAERDSLFQLHCKLLKEETQLIRSALEACMSGDVEVVNIVLNQKESTRERFFRYCPLHIAAEHNRARVIFSLCEGGVNINRLNADNEDAMDIAISHGNTNSVEVLDSILNISTCLLESIQIIPSIDLKRAVDRVIDILKSSADPNITNEDGFNPLQLAVILRHEEYIPILIKSKASLSTLDPRGNNVLQLALKHKLSLPSIHLLSQAYHDVCHDEDSMNKSLLELAVQHPDKRLKMYFEEQLWARQIIKSSDDANLLYKGPAWQSADGWNAPQYYKTIKSMFVKVKNKKQLFVFGRSRYGIHLHSYDFEAGAWISHPMGPQWSDWNGWNNERFYATIQAQVLRENNGQEKIFLLSRHGLSIELWSYDIVNLKWKMCSNGPQWSDGNGWNNAQYFTTIKSQVIRKKDKDILFLLSRHRLAIELWSYDPCIDRWEIRGNGPSWSDNHGWDHARFYATIQVQAIQKNDGSQQLLLLARQSHAIELWSYDVNNCTWMQQNLGPKWSDGCWSSEQNYATIQTKIACIQGSEHLFLLGRHSDGIELWSYNLSTLNWLRHSSGPNWSDNTGWNAKCYWSTIQMQIIKGYDNTDIIMVSGRANGGIIAHAYHPSVDKWIALPYNVALTDNQAWYLEERYSTIQVHTEQISEQNRIFVVARSSYGMHCWSHVINLNLLDRLFHAKEVTVKDLLSKLELEQINNFSNKMKTCSEAFFIMAKIGDWEHLNTLLLRGVYINTVNQNGNNALQNAIISKKVTLPLLNGLIKAGIDLNHVNAKQENAASLAKIHMPHIMHLFTYDPIMGLANSLNQQNNLDDKNVGFLAHYGKAQKYLDKYPSDGQKIEAMMIYYYLLSEMDPYALYTFPIMLMLNQLNDILKNTEANLSDELKPEFLRQRIMLMVQPFFQQTRAAHCSFNEMHLDWPFGNVGQFEYITKGLDLKSEAKKVAARLNTTINDPLVINSLKKTHPEYYIAASKSALSQFSLQVFGLNKTQLQDVDSLSKNLLKYQTEHEALVKATFKASLKQNNISASEIIHDAIDIGLISPRAKLCLSEKLRVWKQSHEALQVKLNKNKNELEEQCQHERKMLQDWLVLRCKEHNEYLQQVNHYFAAIQAAEIDLSKQYNKANVDLKNAFNNARNELRNNYEDAKYHAQMKFATNLAAIAAAAVIAPVLAPEIAGGLCAGIGITAGTTAAAGIALAVEGALMGSLTAAFTGNTNRILRDGFLGAWMAGFGTVMGGILEKSVHIQNANKLFSSEITLMKSGNAVLKQGIVTNAVVSGMKSAIQAGLHGGKLSDNLLSSIGTALALGGSKDLPFINQLNEKLSSVLISASISSAITKTKFLENAVSIGITTLVQTAGSNIGHQVAEAKAKKEVQSQPLHSNKVLLAQDQTPAKKNTVESVAQDIRTMFNRNPVPNGAPNPGPNQNPNPNLNPNVGHKTGGNAANVANSRADIKKVNSEAVSTAKQKPTNVAFIAAKKQDEKQRIHPTPIAVKKHTEEATNAFMNIMSNDKPLPHASLSLGKSVVSPAKTVLATPGNNPMSRAGDELREAKQLQNNISTNWGRMALRSTYEELSGNVSNETYQWRASNRNNNPVGVQYSDAMIKHGTYRQEGVKHALYTLGRGFTQLSLEIGEKIGTAAPGSVARYTDYIKEQNDLWSRSPAAHSICGQFGEGFTHGALYLLPGGVMFQGARSILWMAGTAGITSALYPTQDGLLSTRLAVGVHTAALTGLTGIGLTYAMPLLQKIPVYVYDKGRNVFGNVNYIPKANNGSALNADVMGRSQAALSSPACELNPNMMSRFESVVGELESPIVRTSVLGEGRGLTMQWNGVRNNSYGLSTRSVPQKLNSVERIDLVTNHNASNVNAQAALDQKMRALQKAQKTAVKTKEYSDGRIRYYIEETASRKVGPTRGRSYVTEFNPQTGQVRAWSECYDHQGNVNRVHPKMIDGQQLDAHHYPPTQTEMQSFFRKLRETL